FKLKKGIDNKQASVLIGKHFPEVGDKLYNLLDLVEDRDRSELLLASIEQRSLNLDPIPFTKAIDFRDNLKYIKYLGIPVFILGLIWFSGNLSTFFGSVDRVVNYDLAYEPPAPFAFKLLNTQLDVLESETFTIQVVTEGAVRPENVSVVIDGVERLLQQQKGIYQHSFTPPLSTVDFYFIANGIKSGNYRLNVLKTPSIKNFKLNLDYPKYINKPRETLNSTGNATFPEGTTVSWEIEGENTETVKLIAPDTTLLFNKENGAFNLTKRIYSNLGYQIATSNANVHDHEKLEYEFNVIKDAYPTIMVEQVLDSLNPNISYYAGEATDDYKLTKIRMVCTPENNMEQVQTIEIGTPNMNLDQFYYTFPSGLVLEEGKQYNFYFEAIDNDAIHGGKIAKSQVFTRYVLNEDQLRNRELESQQGIIDNLDRSLEKAKAQKESLKEINSEQKEKSELNFNDQNQIKDFLNKQRQQEDLMQKFSKQLKENLAKDEKDDALNKLLQERLERQEMEAKRNEKLVEELNKIADKIDKEELAKRLEELGKKQQNSERSLEQLVELTKRYYITEKASQLAKDLEKLSEKQEKLSEAKTDEGSSKEQQKSLNTDFQKIKEELEELKKDNEALKKPIELNIDKPKAESIKEDQKEALEEIEKQMQKEPSSGTEEKQKSEQKAKQKQKSAAQKMKEMGEELRASSSAGGGGEAMEEDAEMLRQVLDNLITFSFKQENLFDALERLEEESAQFSGTVRKQQELRELFEHVDDSLFALSLRRAEVSEFVNEQITEVYYNIDKSLESIAEGQVYQGASYQKYVLNASNTLADFLANILDNMQQSMQMGQGQGEGQDFQLPDIIQQQGELKEKMEGMGKSGEGKPQGEQGEGEQGKGEQKGQGEPKPGEGDQPGEGKNGGGSGSEGQNTKDGQGEKGGKNSNGKNGENGNQGNGGPSEEELKEIYEIYKSQQVLRQQLELQLQDMINSSDRNLGEKLIRQMEDFENDLLENGITQRSLSKINTIQYELLKLENAALKQGKKQERESNSNKTLFKNPVTTKPFVLENYSNEIELLQRQALPLRQNFQTKVKDYFKKDD
ncbi:MAG: hypothetical protein WBM83_05140, partial [Flavobacteriaceae bacterium]